FLLVFDAVRHVGGNLRALHGASSLVLDPAKPIEPCAPGGQPADRRTTAGDTKRLALARIRS
ncbi:MAG: hypothetical protein ABJQ57_21945, partial [Nitratireductor sp.]